MNDIAIEISGLGKRYHIPEQQAVYRTLRDTITDSFVGPLRRLWSVARGRAPSGGNKTQAVWALNDLSLEVRHAEVLGIIGRNGSGKSTLLKILSRITNPTTGQARVVGRVGSLLEVGTGFHFELSGRDNVFLSGAMLGMRRSEISRKFDEIVEFSQIGRFLDTPVKHYSSGMYMRLAFSVAAHLQSEILLVDEVLAVGDFDFQKKCLDKMRALTQTGRTVIFVSHSMGSVESLCNRAALLAGGKLVAVGPPVDIIRQYMPREEVRTEGRASWENAHSAPGNDFVSLHAVSVHGPDGVAASELDIRDDIAIRIAFWNWKPGASYVLRVMLRDQDGGWVFSAQNRISTGVSPSPSPHQPRLYESYCKIPGNLLNDHKYSVAIEISPYDLRGGEVLRRDNVLTFKINDGQAKGIDHGNCFLGLVRPKISWHTDWREAA